MKHKQNNGIIPSPYDSRDYKLAELIPLKASKLPKEYESPRTPFVYNQGDSNQCAACAYNTVRYMQECNEEKGGSGIDEPFSPSFNYANRIEGELFEGMYLRSVCKKGKEGSIPYSVFPGFYSLEGCRDIFLQKQAEFMELAKPFAITSYYQCNDRASVKRAIIETGGVITGVWVYDSLYDTDGTGLVNYNPKTDVDNYGGHAIVICGWKTFNDKLYWRIQNSWGVNWGDKGRAWLPEDYPWIESPWAIIDTITETKWVSYKEKNLKRTAK